MSTRADQLAERRAALLTLIDRAIRGEARPLYDFLARHSGLPGPRSNDVLLETFAGAVAMRAPKADALLAEMVTLDPDMGRGGTGYEFVPMCAVASLAERAAKDPKARKACLVLLHDAAEDLRFRVREEVPKALARIGVAQGDSLVHEFEAWTDGYFHASAVLKAFAVDEFASVLTDVEAVVARLDETFALARDAQSSHFRYPGHKELVVALGVTPGALASRLGVPIFDMLERWAKVKEPILREAVAKNLKGSRVAGRYRGEADRVTRALDGSAPLRRDPTTYFGPTRSRGGRAKGPNHKR
ncbi:MAG: hypothetical protein U0169_01590 [Polyangiaceae bacterium]